MSNEPDSQNEIVSQVEEPQVVKHRGRPKKNIEVIDDHTVMEEAESLPIINKPVDDAVHTVSAESLPIINNTFTLPIDLIKSMIELNHGEDVTSFIVDAVKMMITIKYIQNNHSWNPEVSNALNDLNVFLKIYGPLK